MKSGTPKKNKIYIFDTQSILCDGGVVLMLIKTITSVPIATGRFGLRLLSKILEKNEQHLKAC